MKYEGRVTNLHEYNGIRSNMGHRTVFHIDNMWQELLFYRNNASEPKLSESKLKAYEGELLSPYGYTNLHATVGSAGYASFNENRVKLLWAEVQHYRAQVEGKTKNESLLAEPVTGSYEDKKKIYDPHGEIIAQLVFKLAEIDKALTDKCDVLNNRISDVEDTQNKWNESTKDMIQGIREFNGKMEQRVSASHSDMEAAAHRIEQSEKRHLQLRQEFDKWRSYVDGKINDRIVDLEKHVRDGEAFDELRKLIAEKNIKQGDVFTINVKTDANGKKWIAGIGIMEPPKPEIEIEAGMRFKHVSSGDEFTLVASDKYEGCFDCVSAKHNEFLRMHMRKENVKACFDKGYWQKIGQA